MDRSTGSSPSHDPHPARKVRVDSPHHRSVTIRGHARSTCWTPGTTIQEFRVPDLEYVGEKVMAFVGRKVITTAAMIAVLGAPGMALGRGLAVHSAAPGSASWKVVLSLPSSHLLTGLAIDMRGNPNVPKWAYVADSSTQRIVKFGTGGRVLASWPYASGIGPKLPAAVAVGDAGTVFVADQANGRVSKFSPRGKLLGRWAGFVQPRGIVVDHNRGVLVTEYGARRLTILSPAGAILRRYKIQAIPITHLKTWTGWPANPGAIALGSSSGYAENLDEVFIAATCIPRTCIAAGTEQEDQLLQVDPSGPSGTTAGVATALYGSTQSGSAVDEEPWISILSVAADPTAGNNGPRANLFVAGLMRWPHSRTSPQPGVIRYTGINGPQTYWKLPAGALPLGLAWGGPAIYVTQGNRVLKVAR